MHPTRELTSDCDDLAASKLDVVDEHGLMRMLLVSTTYFSHSLLFGFLSTFHYAKGPFGESKRNVVKWQNTR